MAFSQMSFVKDHIKGYSVLYKFTIYLPCCIVLIYFVCYVYCKRNCAETNTIHYTVQLSGKSLISIFYA